MQVNANRGYQLAGLPVSKQAVEDRVELTLVGRASAAVEPQLSLSTRRRHVLAGDLHQSDQRAHDAVLQVGWRLWRMRGLCWEKRPGRIATGPP